MTNEEWREIFTKLLAEAEKRLKDARALRYTMVEKTAAGERDITEEHLAQLQADIDEYRKVLR